MLVSREPARGWGRLIRAALLLGAVVMMVAAYSAAEEGTGRFVSNRRRQVAAVVILGTGASVFTLAIFAWWKSRRVR